MAGNLTVVFDSRDGAVARAPELAHEPQQDLPVDHLRAGVVWRDVIYYQHNHGDPECVEAFYIGSGVWSSLRAPLPSRFGYNVPHGRPDLPGRQNGRQSHAVDPARRRRALPVRRGGQGNPS